MKIILANPRGFCAGVDRAIDIVKAALEKFGAPIFVRHEVVHNRFVVQELKNKGAIFVEELNQIPDNATVIFSAHGISQQVRLEASQRNLTLVLDATCPLVTKVHLEVMRASRSNQECILIGHAGHAEVEGTLGQYDNQQAGMHLVETLEDVNKLVIKNPDNLCYVTQTTLSVDDTKYIIDALRTRYPNIIAPRKDDICYATQNRQDAVRKLATQCDAILVVGSKNSSNSNRLKELSEQIGTKAYLLDGAECLNPDWLHGVNTLGITAGASAPEVLVQDLIKHIQANWPVSSTQEMNGIEENIVFSMPKELRDVSRGNLKQTEKTI
jgi:4-hydroxy-3-methylbut-2-enyl diphosphate reductase